MQDSFTIRQELTFKEFLSSTLYYYLSGRILKRFLLFLIVVSLLLMVLGFATTSESIDLTTLFSIFSPIVILLSALLAFTFFTCLSIYKSKPYLFENVSYDFTHWGVVRNGEQTDFSKPWRDISQIKESKAFFLLYIGNTDYHIIQKRMFNSIEELNNFRQFLNSNIS